MSLSLETTQTSSMEQTVEYAADSEWGDNNVGATSDINAFGVRASYVSQPTDAKSVAVTIGRGASKATERSHSVEIELVDEDFGWITTEVAKLGLPIISVLEGGYDVDALERAARAHVAALIDS